MLNRARATLLMTWDGIALRLTKFLPAGFSLPDTTSGPSEGLLFSAWPFGSNGNARNSEWDGVQMDGPRAKRNLRKPNVSLEVTSTIFGDRLSLTNDADR
jgi:hypothetical protein